MGFVHGSTLGGIIRAAAALTNHRAAALYDFQHRFHKAPAEFPTHERLLLASQILRDHFSHMAAALADWLYVPDSTEWALYLQNDIDNRRNTPEKEIARWKPLTRPWEPEKQKPKLTDAVRSKLKAHAKRMIRRSPRGR